MNRVASTSRRASTRTIAAFVAALALTACVEEQPGGLNSPLIPPTPPSNPQIQSASWRMDVNRTQRRVTITPPTRGLERGDLQIIANYFGIDAGSPDLSILAGDVVEIVIDPATFTSSAVGAFVPGKVRTTFSVAVRNKLSAVNLTTPTFPAPPAGTSGIILFPFEVVVTQTPGGATTGGDGTDVLVELPNTGLVAPSVDWDVAPHNFFNDAGCGAGSTDCYRSETFLSTSNTATISGGATSQSRNIGFDHDPTVSSFRVRMIVSGDLQDATPNQLPTAVSGGPYTGTISQAVTLAGSGTDPDGSITAYNWDFDNDGAWDDSNSATGPFTCSATAGTYPISLRVTDNRSGVATSATTVTCNPPANQAPTANAGGPYSGIIGGAAVQLAGSGNDPDGSITAYAWDLDNDGAFDDSAIQNPTFTCLAPAGSKTVRLQVTDDGATALTGTASSTVDCQSPPPSTLRGRWVDGAGATVTSVASGSTVFLEIDIAPETGRDIHDFQGVLEFTGVTASTAGADLNCTAGSQATCPSGSTTGQTDVMNQYTGNNSTPGQVSFLNFSVNANTAAGTGIQGLARLQFTAGAAGSTTTNLTIQIAVDGAGSDLNPAVSIPTLTIN